MAIHPAEVHAENREDDGATRRDSYTKRARERNVAVTLITTTN